MGREQLVYIQEQQPGSLQYYDFKDLLKLLPDNSVKVKTLGNSKKTKDVRVLSVLDFFIHKTD